MHCNKYICRNNGFNVVVFIDKKLFFLGEEIY